MSNFFDELDRQNYVRAKRSYNRPDRRELKPMTQIDVDIASLRGVSDPRMLYPAEELKAMDDYIKSHPKATCCFCGRYLSKEDECFGKCSCC